MLQPTPQSVAEPDWRAVADWRPEARPAGLWPWLTVHDSLTERLRRHFGPAFTLQLLTEQQTVFAAADTALLGGNPQGVCREVTLNNADTPLVYARTLLPDAVLAAQPDLQTLGNTPLGDAVFNGAAATTRRQLEVAQLSATHALYQAAAIYVAQLPASIWARRSVLQIAAQRVLIYEVFLPTLMESAHGG